MKTLLALCVAAASFATFTASADAATVVVERSHHRRHHVHHRPYHRHHGHTTVIRER